VPRIKPSAQREGLSGEVLSDSHSIERLSHSTETGVVGENGGGKISTKKSHRLNLKKELKKIELNTVVAFKGE